MSEQTRMPEPEDTIEGCQAMIDYHEIDLAIVGNAKDLSPVAEMLARDFIQMKLMKIGYWRRCLKSLQTK